MNMELIVNLILCIIILALGIWAYTQKRGETPLFIGIAFGLFGTSHFLKLAGLGVSLASLLVVIRVIAYLLVLIALSRVAIKGRAR